MGNRVKAALEQVLSCHQDVAQAVKHKVICGEGVPQGELNRWCVVHALFARSSNYARAAKLLLFKDESYWEAAGVLTRTVFEDASVLAYVHSREDQAEGFALLYGKSDAPERWRARERLRKHKIVSTKDSKTTERDLKRRKKEFRALRDQLWTGDRDEEGRPCFQDANSWNGLTIAGTFREAGLAMQYDCHYAQLCELVHSSVFALSYAFDSDLGLKDMSEANEAGELSLWVARHLILALGMELAYAKELIGVGPKAGMPDLRALMEEARVHHSGDC